jgi:hypothetical protein
VLTWIIQMLAGIISLLLTRLVLRLAWRRVGDNPFCARCGYDLRGRPENTRTCAECGSDLVRRRAIRRGVPVRRRAWLAVIPMLVVVAVWSLVFGVSGFRKQDWQPYKPFRWLLRDLEANDPLRRTAADRELRRRFPRLSESQLHTLVDARHLINGAPNGVSNVSVLAGVKLRRASKLEGTRWIALCRNLIKLSLATRSSVREGDPIAFRAMADITATLPELRMSVMVDVDNASVDTLPLEPDMAGLHTLQLFDRRECCGQLTEDQWRLVAPGAHRLDSTVVVQIRFGTYSDTTLCEMMLPVTTTLNVVPHGATSAMAISDPSPALLQALQPLPVGRGWVKVQLGDSQSRLPEHVAFNVFVRQGLFEHPVGSFHAVKGTSAPFVFTTPPIPIAAEGFDVILRPSLREAARSTQLGDIWPDVITFADVTKARPDPLHAR